MSVLAEATCPQTNDADLVLVPVGSIEQHGPHLPLDTDTVIAQAVTARLAARLGDAWIAPPLSYGASGEHQAFPGTCSIGNEALRTTLVELVRSVGCWARRVVFVNAHGGNVQALGRAVDQLVAEGHDVVWVPCATENVDLHAGRTETSLMLHLAPWTVRRELAEVGNTQPLKDILPALKTGGVVAVSTNGVLGDPTGATAEEGAQVLEAIVSDAYCRLNRTTAEE